MENIEIAPTEQIQTQPVVETTYPDNSFASGGEVQGSSSGYRLIYYLMFGLFIAAPLYSIYYHRQALQKLHNEDDSTENNIKKDITELKRNLKRLMGNKYEHISQ